MNEDKASHEFDLNEELDEAEHTANHERIKAALTEINTEMGVMPWQHGYNGDEQEGDQ